MAEIVIVGASHKDLTTDARSKLVALDDSAASPVKDLVKGGHALAVLRVDTCARVEWIVVAEKPEWAAELLEAAVARRAATTGLHRHVGDAALAYLFRVALGLDSVVEGEAAIGRQVLQAFSDAHAATPLEPTLRRLWHSVTAVIGEKRRAIVAQLSGVERLVADAVPLTLGGAALRRSLSREGRGEASPSPLAGEGSAERSEAQGEGPVVIFGRGEIARAIERELNDRSIPTAPLFGRDRLDAFHAALHTASCAVVAASAHEAWLDLPARTDAPLCIDASSPVQVRSPGGFTLLTLDDLFKGTQALEGSTHARLEALVDAALTAYKRPDATTPQVLEELMRHKTRLLEERLPPLLEAVDDPELKKKLKKEVHSFSHEMITTVRKGGGQ